jgi:hypothetical protein
VVAQALGSMTISALENAAEESRNVEQVALRCGAEFVGGTDAPPTPPTKGACSARVPRELLFHDLTAKLAVLVICGMDVEVPTAGL